jgi:hypothetical protein
VTVTPAMRARIVRSPKDMTIAILVLIIPIFIALAVYRWMGGESPTIVDASIGFADARAGGQFTVLEPTGAASGWRPVSYQYSSGTLRVGYLTPSGKPMQLLETNRPFDVVRAEEFPGGLTAAAPGDGDWQIYRAAGESALVLDDGKRVVIVRGPGDIGELREFTGLLH